MRHALAALLLSILSIALPSLADARPITAGINLGLSQSKTDGEAGLDASQTIGLFGRLAFNQRISGQLEIQRIQTDDYSGVDIRTGTALLVIDLGAKGRLVPILLAGIGIASATTQYAGSTDAHHIEGGLGLEYRAEGGLTIGADLRMGGRSIDSEDYAYPAYEGDTRGTGQIYYAPSTLQEGEYRSARVTVGVRF